MTADEGLLSTPDGPRIHWRCLGPEAPRGAVVVVHGLAEHAGRYAHVLSFLAGRAFAAYGFDLRGHGRSDGLGGHVDSFEDYLQDLRAVHEHAARRHPGLPLFLLGHSMGGLVALRYAQQGVRGLAGLVLLSPLLAIAPASRPSPARAALGRACSAVLPRIRLSTHVDASRLSRDASVGEAYLRDPLVGRKVSARWFTAVASAMDDAQAASPAVPIPTLVMAAGDDSLADTATTLRFAAGAPPAMLDMQLWDGFYHELLNAPEKAQVLGRVEEWIAGQLG